MLFWWWRRRRPLGGASLPFFSFPASWLVGERSSAPGAMELFELESESLSSALGRDLRSTFAELSRRIRRRSASGIQIADGADGARVP